MTKICGRCKQERSLEDFHVDNKRKDKRAWSCKECIREYNKPFRDKKIETSREWQKNNPRRYKDTKLRKQYSISIDDYEAMVEAQENKCAICKNEMVKPHIDHDHSCCPGTSSCGNCIRGLLCFSCNVGLGKFEDNENRLRSAADYLAINNLLNNSQDEKIITEEDAVPK